MIDELRDLRLMRLLIKVVGGDRHVVSLEQVELWLERMTGRPITTRAGGVVQLGRNLNLGGELVYYLQDVTEESSTGRLK
jgi:hypothetical protein